MEGKGHLLLLQINCQTEHFPVPRQHKHIVFFPHIGHQILYMELGSPDAVKDIGTKIRMEYIQNIFFAIRQLGIDIHIGPQILVWIVPDIFPVPLVLNRIPLLNNLLVLCRQFLLLVTYKGGRAAVINIGVVAQHMLIAQLLRTPAEVILLAAALFEGFLVEQTYPVNNLPLDEHAKANRNRDSWVLFQAAAFNNSGIFVNGQSIRNGVLLAEIRDGAECCIVGKRRDCADGFIGVSAGSELFNPTGSHNGVRVQQHHIPVRILQSPIDSSGKSLVLLVLHYHNPRLLLTLQIWIDLGVRALVINQYHTVDLQIRMFLDALHAQLQIFQRIIYRDDNINSQILFCHSKTTFTLHFIRSSHSTRILY